MPHLSRVLSVFLVCLMFPGLLSVSASAQKEKQGSGREEKKKKPSLPSGLLSSMKLRAIGPALNSGRIGDFAVNPDNPSEYYVAVCSGGVWKTSNRGVTYKPVFDSQGSYSIGCITMDPSNSQTIWVGTGENNSQRSVSWGDGVYRSLDGGRSWKNMGLKESEHIGMIVVHPDDPDTIYVAAQGPLWRSGGDRGLYRSQDGGATWQRILHVSDDTGVNEVHMDPRNPQVLYASAYQRRRRVWTLINGGPESGLYKSEDGGDTWRKINRGLPGGDKGRIGLAVSPANPDILYAIVEAQGGGGVYRSINRGESWTKRSSYMTSSPQYYNELTADPKNPDRFYALDTFLHYSNDGGRTMVRLPSRGKHVDNHALWIDPADTNHLLVGCDGGIYETWDLCRNWQYKPNLPVTQFYKLALDNDLPFYNVYGGTQDNNTLGGPVATTRWEGIMNEDWFVTVGGDGFEPAVDPTDPNIVYSQWQYGGLVRYDRRTGETVDIKPRERLKEAPNRWNWDSALLISPHDHRRIYYASQRLYRSDDRGQSWRAVSGDLTRQVDRNRLKVMGKIQKVDAVSKNRSTSPYGTIVALTESPLQEGLIYVGTDDGLIQVTENGGESWRAIDQVKGVPRETYVSSLTASVHDVNTVFATFDNHKNGDFKPYVAVSHDRGASWKLIGTGLPANNVCYALRQDHVDKNLLFVGAEYGAFVSVNGGTEWHKLKGVPTIAVRDLEIQRRENDLVLATFGRGFHVLDDYTPLRHIDLTKKEAAIFPVRPARRYLRHGRGRGSQGNSFYRASNPPFGAAFTWWLKEVPKSLKSARKKKEKDPEYYPSWDELREEDRERSPYVLMTIRDAQGQVVRRMKQSAGKGVHRSHWDLRYGTSLSASRGGGPLAPCGTYSVDLALVHKGEVKALGASRTFEVKPLEGREATTDRDRQTLALFHKMASLARVVRAAGTVLSDTEKTLETTRTALLGAPRADLGLLKKMETMRRELLDIRVALLGDTTLTKRSAPAPISISSRISTAQRGLGSITSEPTQTWRECWEDAQKAFEEIYPRLKALAEKEVPALQEAVEKAGGAWTKGKLPALPGK